MYITTYIARIVYSYMVQVVILMGDCHFGITVLFLLRAPEFNDRLLDLVSTKPKRRELP